MSTPTSPTTIDRCAITALVDGESAGVLAIEVVRIPHESALGDVVGDNSTPLSASITEAEVLLHDLHQVHLGHASPSGHPRDVALEFLWRSVPAESQVHTASVHLYLLLRALGPTVEEVVAALRELEAVTLASLSSSGYDFAVLPPSALRDLDGPRDGHRTLALVREEWVEALGSSAVPEVYAYDRLPLAGRGLDRIANSLIEYPDATVSIQVTPTTLAAREKAVLEDHALKLGNLGRGISDPSLGTVSFHAASVRARTYDYYADHKDGPLFITNVLVRGRKAAVSVICARVHSHLHHSPEHASFAARYLDVSEVDRTGPLTSTTMPWRVAEFLLEDTRDVALWGAGPQRPPQGLFRLPWIMTAEEVAQIGRLPIADRRLGAGFEINYTERESRNYSRGVIGSTEIPVGHLKGSAKHVEIGFGRSDLTKHLLVTGTPGSGKTTFTLGLIDRLWHDYGIPTLIIEPAKTEYRGLVATIPDLQVFTPGKSHVSPFVLNPFLPPTGVRLEAWKSVLRTAFSAGLTMTTPLDRIFEEAVNRAYSHRGWLDEHTVADGGDIFAMQDFVAEFKNEFERIGYTGEAQNIGRAGLVRLQGLIGLFDTERSLSIEQLLSRPTLIELAAIENDEQKALVISLILLGVLAYVNANVPGDGRLKHVLLLEEAHVLLDADERTGGSGAADPTRVAKRLIKRILAEARAYGLAMLVADQSPRKVSLDVVALTGVKVGFRLVEDQDRAIFAGATNLSESQQQRLGQLQPGQAFLFYDQLDVPEEIVTPDHRSVRGIQTFLPDDELKRRHRFWDSHADLLVPFALCEELPDWDHHAAPRARQIARRLFTEHFTPASADVEVLVSLYRRLPQEVRRCLPRSSEIDRRTTAMVALYLLRSVRNQTLIPLSEARVRSSLRALGGDR